MTHDLTAVFVHLICQVVTTIFIILAAIKIKNQELWHSCTGLPGLVNGHYKSVVVVAVVTIIKKKIGIMKSRTLVREL